MGEVVKVATVFIHLDADKVLGQEGVKITQTVDEVDLSVKANFPDQVLTGGWTKGSLECDGLMFVGEGGFADLSIKLYERTVVPVQFIDEESGEVMNGQALMTETSADAPKDKAPTFTCKLSKSGPWVWTAGT